MSRTFRQLTKALAVLFAVGAVLGVAACGNSDDNGSDSSSSSSSTTASGGTPEKIVIAYQAIPNGDLIVKNKGWLEEALPDTQIEWKLFDSGGNVNEAFAAGSVDIGLAGSSPVARGLSQPLDYQVIWIHDVIGKAESLVAKDGINSIADLKGKKIATPLASTAHYSLLAALEKEGLQQKDVEIIDAEPPDIAAAWERGDIDAAYVWNPVLAQLVKDGGKILIDSEQLAAEGKTTYDLGVASNEFIEKYPDVLNTWAEQQNKAVELYKSNPDEAIAAVAAELNLKPDEVKPQMEDLIYLTAAEQATPEYLGGKLGKDLFATAEFNKDLGQIPTVRPEQDYVDAVNESFAKAAAGR
jgi:taurine transport system substrate-binding protein